VEAIIYTSSWKHDFCDDKLSTIDVINFFLFLYTNFYILIFSSFYLKMMKTMTKIKKVEEICSNVASNDPENDKE